MAQATKPDVCPECGKELVGDVTLESAFLGRVNFLVLEETPDRNWIQCDACNKTVCKDCCINPISGYCDQCFYKIVVLPYQP